MSALAETLLVAAPDQLPARDWLVSLLAARQKLSATDRHALLSGRSPVPMPAIGRVVCACFHVCANKLASAVAAWPCKGSAVAKCLKTGIHT